MTHRFWEAKSLAELSPEEWEALCDGCGKCCLYKLEDEDTGRVYYTDVACRFLDLGTCRCRDYAGRRRVADCIVLTPRLAARLSWLPETCAYRRLARGRPLPPWHPLLTGEADSVRRAGHSACAFAVSETEVETLEDLEEHVLAAPP